jgi:transcriptional regulator with XRE-family HTH domain
METKLTGAEVRRLRTRNGWSLQYLANLSGVNKAYLSEFENGQRTLPQQMVDSVRSALLREPPGRATPTIVPDHGHNRLVFIDPATGHEIYRPRVAHITWTDDDGTSYRMYVGEP